MAVPDVGPEPIGGAMEEAAEDLEAVVAAGNLAVAGEEWLPNFFFFL